MNRKWMVAAGLAAVVALVVGAAVGRSIIPSDTKDKAATTTPTTTRFADPTSGVSLRYPLIWARLHSRDPQVPFVAALSPATSVSLRVSKSQLTDVTAQTLPVVRGFTDDLVGADERAQQLGEPKELTIGGLPAIRYRYTYPTPDGKTGAHVHYFIFKHDLMLQLVFQQVPASDLAKFEPTFNQIAATLTSRG